MNQTLAVVWATLRRAEGEGAKNVVLNIHDLKELLPFIESGMHKERVGQQMRPAGWANPQDLQASLSGSRADRKRLKLSRFKSAGFNVQMYFCDDLAKKAKESEAMVRAQHAEQPKETPDV